MQDKVVVVTGGASLIAEAVARRFVTAGARVVLADVNEQLGHEVASAVGSGCVFVSTDVTEDAQLDRLVQTAVDRFGGVDILVSAAVTFEDAGLAGSRAEWHRALDINMVSTAVLISKLVPLMQQRGGGSIVTIASVSGKQTQPNRTVYNVTKAALLMLTKAAAQALAPENIRVNSVSPGWVWSRNLEARYGTRQRADALGAEFHALGRMADPDEIAAAVVFLASDEASFATGGDLAVDGGYSAMGPEALGQAFQKIPTLQEEAER